MKILDRIFGCLLALGGIGHGFGAYQAYHSDRWPSFGRFLLRSLSCFSRL